MTPSPYDASRITVLNGLEAVRRRPAMYVGSTDAFGLHRLAFELIDNSLDEILSGFGSTIEVTVHTDGSLCVSDDGRGIPVDPHPHDGRPGCEVVLTTLHAGAKFDKSTYTISGGLLGIGLSCVNALSERLQIDIRRDGQTYRQRYQRGQPIEPLVTVGVAEGSGTAVCFAPDRSLFSESAIFSPAILLERLQELAFLHSGVRLTLIDNRCGLRESFEFGGGPAQFVAHRNQDRVVLHPDPLVIECRDESIDLRLALQWTRSYDEDLHSFVNFIRTRDGGSHVDGLHAAIAISLNNWARRAHLLDERDDSLEPLDALEGLTCVLAIQLAEPQFEGATKARLRQEDVANTVKQTVTAGLDQLLTNNSALAAAIVGRALETLRARRAIRAAGERAHYWPTSVVFEEEVYRTQFTIRSRNWHQSATWITQSDLLSAHAEACAVPAGSRLLDVCCGSGVVGAAFRHRVGATVGLDLTPAMADLARTRLDEVHLGTVYDLPFDDATFDIVVTREVLHLLPHPQVPVSEILRVLRPGGQFIVGQTLPYGPEDAAWMWRIFKKKQPLICNMFHQADFFNLLSDAGFERISMRDLRVWEDIDRWIDTHETSPWHRQEIRHLYSTAPYLVRGIHPFEISPGGRLRDCWRWGVFSGWKPL
jgi:DNA gyrase subunit B